MRGSAAAAFHQGLLASALVTQGRHDEAGEAAAEARASAAEEDALVRVAWITALARVESARGSSETARSLAAAAVELAQRTDGLTMQADALAALAAVLRAAGDEAGAAEAAQRASELYERKGAVAAPVTSPTGAR